MRVGLLAVRLESKFWAEHGSILIRTNGCTVRFSPHPRQTGFANAGDARPSHWKPLADVIFHAVQRADCHVSLCQLRANACIALSRVAS